MPSGVSAYDRVRFGKAEATPAVLAVPAILATAAAAYGVYVTGTSLVDYNANVQALYDGYSNASSYWSQSWAAYCQEKGSFDNAMQSCVTADGEISLQQLTDAGFWDGLRQYSAFCVQQGTSGVAQTSIPETGYQYTLLGCSVPTCSDDPFDVPYSSYAQGKINYAIEAGYQYFGYNRNYWTGQGTDYVSYCLYFNHVDIAGCNDIDVYPLPVTTYTSGGNTFLKGADTSGQSCRRYVIVIDLYRSDNSLKKASTMLSETSFPNNANNQSFICQGRSIAVYSGGDVTQAGSLSSPFVTSVIQSVLDGTATIPTETVEPFEPTVEQLQAGYTYEDVVAAINSGSGAISADLSGIASQITGLTALLSPLAGIAANVQNIRDWWSSFATSTTTPIPWYQALWNSLLGVLGNTPLATLLSPISSGVAAIQTWLGDTPFGDVMGDLLDGVLGIPDAVAQGAADVCGVLDGVLDASLGLAGDIADALGLDALVDSILSPLVGVYEAVTGKDGTPSFFTDNVTLGLPNGFDDGLRLRLEDKVPFCYVIRSYTAIGQMFGNFSGNRSFYLDLDIPNAGTVRMDGEIVLSQRMGTLDIATTIRILATSLLCLGLLYRAYKVVERGTGGF